MIVIGFYLYLLALVHICECKFWVVSQGWLVLSLSLSLCRSWYCVRGLPRSPHQVANLSVLGHHFLPYAPHTWTGYHGNQTNYAVHVCMCVRVYGCVCVLV